MASKKSTTHFWTDEETEFMLHQVQELNILKFVDGRRTRNGNLFQKIASAMEEAGFVRTPEQVRIKWKNTRTAYNNAKRNNGKSGQSCPHYDFMDDLLGRLPLSPATQRGVDAGGVEEANQKTEMGEHDEQHQLDDDSFTNSSRSSTPMPGTSAHPIQPRRKQGNPDSFAQLCKEVRETRTLLLQELRESGEHLRQLTDLMRESRVDHNRNLAALIEGINNLKQPAPSPHTQHPYPSHPARRLDIDWKPNIKLHRIELKQQHVHEDKEVIVHQQLSNQERNSSLDQEDSEPPQIKEEQEDLSSQEGEQLVLKQETDIFNVESCYNE